MLTPTMAAMATAVYARVEPAGPDGVRMLCYANAGHPAPLLFEPDGKLVRLDEQRSPMIGASRDRGRRTASGRPGPVRGTAAGWRRPRRSR